MNLSNRKASSRAALPAGLLLIGLFGAASVSAADSADAAGSKASCGQETRKVAVWPQGGNPKNNQHARFEERVVMVCDGKVVSKPQPASREAHNVTR